MFLLPREQATTPCFSFNCCVTLLDFYKLRNGIIYRKGTSVANIKLFCIYLFIKQEWMSKGPKFKNLSAISALFWCSNQQ
jgi:hypothetical protein